MRQLNKGATKTFNKVVSIMGSESHIKIDNTDGVFMSLSFELLSEINFNGVAAKLFAMAHYYLQNGDLIPDPDMTFLQLIDTPDVIFPASMTNGFGFKEGIWNDDGKWVMDVREQADQTVFANMWLKNIKEQQKLN